MPTNTVTTKLKAVLVHGDQWTQEHYAIRTEDNQTVGTVKRCTRYGKWMLEMGDVKDSDIYRMDLFERHDIKLVK